MTRKKTKPKKKKKLSLEERNKLRVERKFYSDFRSFMREMSYVRVSVDGIEIQFDGRTGEIDDLFVYENIIAIVEYATGKSDSSHILKKKPLYDKILADVPGFLELAKTKYPQIIERLNPLYSETHYKIRIFYVPVYEAAQETINTCKNICFFQGSTRKYFLALAKTIHVSARVEFFNYLGIEWQEVGPSILKASTGSHEYVGQLLPESMSSFPKGYKVVSFYADPESLMTCAYVLRRDGWKDNSHLYQRILGSNKITKMRRFLIDQERVFINNLIVTLPPETVLNHHDAKGTNVPQSELNTASQ